MEFYPTTTSAHQHQHLHQQQQQAEAEADSAAHQMDTDSSPANSSASGSSRNNNSSPPNATTAAAAATDAATDAATVAAAKEMLELHQGLPSAANANANNNAKQAQPAKEALDLHHGSASAATFVAAAETVSTTHMAIAPPQSSENSPPALTTLTNANAYPEDAFGMLKYEHDLLYITEACTVIGRNSSTSLVNFHVAENNLVSRKHFQILYDVETREFYVQCLSKNGIFVDDFLQRRNADPLKLNPSCYFRFPSTEIRILFESFMHAPLMHSTSTSNSGVGDPISYVLNNNNNHSLSTILHNSNNISGHGNSSNGNAHVIISPAPPDELQHLHPHHSQIHHQHSTGTGSSHLLPMDTSNVLYSPLKITIPKKEQKSPYLSPTGTISAANSCPASPRQGFHQSQSSYNTYANNNLQNQDLFQTPSTVNYNINEKPPYSYAQLIVQAISAAPDKQLTLSGIYSFIVKNYPYYRKETNKGWQNSIRHNLSLNRYFIKVARSQDEPGKGSFWRIDPESGAKLIDHSYKKRRQRSSQGFRPSYGMPRSAPVSPSHMEYIADNSRESSPLQDIVLQSAPGSPGMAIENRASESDLMYNSQNMPQAMGNNSHNQYNNGSPLYIPSQNVIGISGGHQSSHAEMGVGGGGNGVGALIALKRNHAMSAGAAASAMGGLHLQSQSQQNQQPLHPDIIYEELPTDYSGGTMDGSGDECDSVPKRSKYIAEVL